MDITDWSQLAVICLLGAISPGPSLALVIGNTLAGGRLYGVATSLGHAIGIGWWAFLTAVGLAGVIVAKPGVVLILQLAGACLLAYIGLRTITSKDHMAVGDTYEKRYGPAVLLRGAGEGLLISLFNPKIAVFFLAIFTHFIHDESSWVETFYIAITAALIDALWYVVVALAIMGTGLVGFLRYREARIRKFSGAILILIALYLLVAIIPSLS